MSRKAYVIFMGRIPGVYESWVECQEQVNGYHGCSYSSFPNREEAERAWLDWINRGGGVAREVVLALPAPNIGTGGQGFNVMDVGGGQPIKNYEDGNHGPLLVGDGYENGYEPNDVVNGFNGMGFPLV
ncbi:Ribosomal protein L9/RNase H1, N-terminal [Sesbania bispinosa]|nr:Ribosomal protein L9/RNase H1, N-terminal [Sesbania bispinosa]